MIKLINQLRNQIQLRLAILLKEKKFKTKRYYFFIILVPILLGFSLIVYENCAPNGLYSTAGSGSNSTARSPVTPSCTSTAHASWIAPTTNTDGSALTDLSQYKIYIGVISGVYDTVISITDPTLTAYQITNMQPGIYYFAMTAINSSGVESGHSAEVVANLSTCGASIEIGFGRRSTQVAENIGLGR